MQYKYALFIEPDAALAAYISSLKAEVAQWRPQQKYCNHPPHSTLLVGYYSDLNNWMNNLKAVLTQRPFSIHIKKWMVFPNDPQTNGGQTVTLAVEPSAELSALQMTCAEVLKANKLPAENYPPMSEPLSGSFREYGFPFVGSHWLPHFSIASLAVEIDDPFLMRLTSRPVAFTTKVSSVSIWRIKEDEHHKLVEINLQAK